MAAFAYETGRCAGTAPDCGVVEPDVVEAGVCWAEGEAALVMGGMCGGVVCDITRSADGSDGQRCPTRARKGEQALRWSGEAQVNALMAVLGERALDA